MSDDEEVEYTPGSSKHGRVYTREITGKDLVILDEYKSINPDSPNYAEHELDEFDNLKQLTITMTRVDPALEEKTYTFNFVYKNIRIIREFNTPEMRFKKFAETNDIVLSSSDGSHILIFHYGLLTSFEPRTNNIILITKKDGMEKNFYMENNEGMNELYDFYKGIFFRLYDIIKQDYFQLQKDKELLKELQRDTVTSFNLVRNNKYNDN